MGEGLRKGTDGFETEQKVVQTGEEKEIRTPRKRGGGWVGGWVRGGEGRTRGVRGLGPHEKWWGVHRDRRIKFYFLQCLR